MLDKLPKKISKRLLFDEFQNESLIIATLRILLEKTTNSYIVTYKRNTFYKNIKPEHHLCANISGAKLNKLQLMSLKLCERIIKTQNVSFSAYKKPIELVSPPRFPDVK